MPTDNFWGKFRRWRRTRPFWGGLLLLLSGLELFYSANMSLGAIEVHIGPQGFLSYLLPLIMVLVGLLVWFTPAQRLFYAIIGLLTALYSFIGLNLGGFIIGMLLGILGGALVIAWGPPRVRPDAPPAGPAPAEDTGPQHADDTDPDHAPGPDRITEEVEVAGHDDRPPADERFVPGFDDEPTRRVNHPRALSIALVVLSVTASFLIAGSKLPARADVECPEGLPSRSATAGATSKATPSPDKSSSAAAPAVARKKPAASGSAAASQPVAAEEKKTDTKTDGEKATDGEEADDSTGNPIVDGFNDFVDGVGNLLGIDDDESPSPSTSPSPSKSTDPAPTTAPAEPEPKPTTTSSSPAPESSPSTTPTKKPSPSPSADEIPCLGARIFGKTASADDIPFVSKKPGLMEVGKLDMYGAGYDGVVDMPVQGGGSFKALKFSMDRAVNTPFSLTIDEAGGAQTVIKSDQLTTTGTVKFYTPKMTGKLFGLIPVTFTPEQPPPLTLPYLLFTDVEIQLAFVRCDTLTAKPLDISEKS